MSNYYEKRDAKVRIARELMDLGWKVYGFHEDDSDMMTDYYSPASWSGLAEKNGYILVVDNKYEGKESEIKRRNPNYINMSNSDNSKIESLKNMTVEKGATEGEEKNAKKLISKIKAKYEGQEVDMWEVIGTIPAHLGNSNGSIWHLEKDGCLVEKGNKLTIFADVPAKYEFDIAKMEYKDSYKTYWNYQDEKVERKLNDSQLKAVNEFKSFILKLERIVNFGNSCGDGTKETEEAFQQQNEDEKMVKKTFERTKKVVKLEEVKRENSLQIGDVVYCSSGLCMITEVRENLYWSVKLGSASRGYQESKKVTWTLSRKSFDHSLVRGNLKVYDRVESEEIEKYEKWVKSTTKKETVKAETTTENKKEVETEQTTSVTNNIEFEVVEDVHTKTGEKIFVANLVDRVEKDVFMTILSKIKKLGGYYYKYKGGFIFSEDPVELLKNNFSKSVEKEEKNIFINKIDIESVASYIVDTSSTLIDNMNLSKYEYWNNEEYKNKLLQIIKDRKLTKNQFKSVIEAIEQHEEYKEYKELIEVLNGFYALNNSNKNNSSKSDDKEKNISKIEKQIESNNKTIEKLSGNYQTNTWKRMKEQESRDNQRQALEKDNLILEYIKEKIITGNVSGFEKALITRTLRNDFKSYYSSFKSNIKYNREDNNMYPSINPNWNINDSWSQDQLKRIKRLKEINLNDDRQLKNTLINDYQEIINTIENKNNFSEIEQKIKKLEREYKMQQKGDINFTPKELVKLLIDYADIKETDRVLEPTAGIGNIADQLKEYTNNIDCIEYMHSYNELLKLKGYNVIGNDFMECTNHNTYDCIVANFPFSKEQEMIKHAYKMLKNNGRMAVITSNHWTFANDNQSKDFRSWLDNLDYEVYESDIKFEFTSVNYKILIINKDENINSVAV